MWLSADAGAVVCVVAAILVLKGIGGVADYFARRDVQYRASMQRQAALYRYAEQLRKQVRA